MKKIFVILLLLAGITAFAQNSADRQQQVGKVEVRSWTLTPMDGSRVGAKSPSSDDVKECLGEIRHGKYYAPDGKVYGRRTATYKAAKELLSVQDRMAPRRETVGYSTREMDVECPESELSNSFMDNLLELDGEPLDDARWYGVATISFLLEGGDGLYLANNSRNMKIYDIDIIDIILDKVKSLSSEGKPIEYHTDGRVVIEK